VRYFVILSSFLLIVSFWSCGKKEDFTNSPKEIAFYYWHSKCDIKKDFSFPLFVKVLDIGSNIIKTNCSKKEFIPVVYIDNQALKKRGVEEIYKIILENVPIDKKELQIDCDWTRSTKKSYFTLLKRLKKRYKNITATIRLHQLKYQTQTGIPPVDGGVLMLYNMSDFLNPDTKNYILDLDIAKKYFIGFKTYPLNLDLALPLYSMATVLRYGRVVFLIDGVRKDMIDNKFQKISNNSYKVLKTHYFRGKLLYEGDKIRIDEVSLDMLKKAKKIIPFEYKRVIFFRYDKNFTLEFLKELEAIFKK